MLATAATLAGLIALVGVVAAELVCRSRGLHAPLLYERTTYGYRVKPSQDLRRFGNRLRYNRFGMRSDEIDPLPAQGIVRILCIGDSVTYGGATTDQRETYPALLEALLRERGIAAEVLNISAGGWAPANEAGWLRANGTFGSRLVIVQLGTDDLFQHEMSGASVGSHPQFPARAPLLGLQELMTRYVVPRVRNRLARARPVVADERTLDTARAVMREVVAMLDAIARDGAEPLVMLTEQAADREPRDATTQAAKALLIETLRSRDVALYRPAADLAFAAAQRPAVELFRDPIHPSPAGNRILAAGLARKLESRLPVGAHIAS